MRNKLHTRFEMPQDLILWRLICQELWISSATSSATVAPDLSEDLAIPRYTCTETILTNWKKAAFLKVIKMWIIYKFFKISLTKEGRLNTENINVDNTPICMKGLGSHSFRTTTEVQSRSDAFDKSRMVITFLANLGDIGILCTFTWVLERKTG